MERHQWNYEPAYPGAASLLERFHTHTHDIEEAQRWGMRAFCDNELRLLDARTPVDARLCYRKLGGVGVGRISYGCEVTINPRQFDTFYLVQMPLRSGEYIDSGREVVTTSPSLGCVLNAERPMRIRHAADTDKLIVRVDRALLERHCGKQFTRAPQRQIVFDTAMPLESPIGRRWMRTIAWLFDMVDDLGDESLAPAPMVVAQIEQMIATMLLAFQRSNVSGLLEENSRPVTPTFVRKAEQFIGENAHEPITVCEIAEHIGVSSRSLYTGFRKYRGTSPMQFLKDIRLQRVHEQLSRADAGKTTVTAVAHHWGFVHLGHFTTDYKRCFGESPSETLTR